MEACGEDTLYITVSDHGATPNGPDFSPYDVLVPAGLTVMKEVKTGTGRGFALNTEYGAKLEKKLTMISQEPDVNKSTALPQRSCYVYVNLKGRDPEGIVEPADYEKVQQEIIDALLTYVDPKTGKGLSHWLSPEKMPALSAFMAKKPATSSMHYTPGFPGSMVTYCLLPSSGLARLKAS